MPRTMRCASLGCFEMRSKHCNIPLFIPHMGCPHRCVFCNQNTISGCASFDANTVPDRIRTALQTIPPDADCEIAYFGGSFTGIDRSLMVRLLDIAQSFVDGTSPGQARVRGIRMSTRPDYLPDDVLRLLSRYSVTTVELGVQSMDDGVLRACRRGHTSLDAENACRAVKQAGYQLIGQMMIGLPGADSASEVKTAKELVALGVDGVRIYPTVVFAGTELHACFLRGDYTPMTMEETIARCCAVLQVFDQARVPCIRLGLCASDGVRDAAPGQAAAHPAIGEQVRSALYEAKIRTALSAFAQPLQGRVLELTVPRGEVSRAIGQHGINRQRLLSAYGFREMRVREGETFCVSVADGAGHNTKETKEKHRN